MISRLIIFLVLVPALLIGTLNGQDIVRSKTVAGVCYAGKNVNRIYIPPPEEFYRKGASKGADINVIYNGFTSVPRAAFDYAVSILASILPEDTRFTIKANWQPISDQGVLGQTSVSSYFRGSAINALHPNAYYPVALAEKILGLSLNFDTEPDVELTLNSRSTWYTGTSGNTPSTMYDLVTVVIHELCHGLGFFDSFSVENGVGTYGLANNIPVVYDKFIESKQGLNLVDPLSFPNNSTQLGDQLTGGQLYFDGPMVSRYALGVRPRIFAPSEWDPGSSISHLDENATLQKDALMTPYIALGEAIHDPGKLTVSILGDLGWTNTRLIHIPVKDTESPLSEVQFKAVVESDTVYYKDNVGLVYSFDKFVTSDTLFLIPPQVDDTFRITVDIPSYQLPVSYFFFVTDTFGRIYSFPSSGKTSPYYFFVGTDTVKPKLNHVPLGDFFDKTPSLTFRAVCTDNIGVDTVYLEYRKNTGSFKTIGLKNDSLDLYSLSLNLEPEMITQGDSLQYRIVSVDRSSLSNTSVLPAAGYYSIHFEASLAVVRNYFTDFTGAGNQFLNTGFSVSTPNLFTNAGLNSVHPYESPETDEGTIEYISYLRHPIKVDSSGLFISYDEIVLVEPGEPGSVYPSNDFYDYVIIEASKNYGLDWFALADGYDCRIASVFESAYNSSMSLGNSTYKGTPDMFRKHTVDIRTFEKFLGGDTLLIRFRLFSDPYAHGWGWAIDNLNIGSSALGIEDIPEESFNIYPNPGSGEIKIDPGESGAGSKINYSVYNSAGIKLSDGVIGSGTDNTISISQYPPGLYIIVFRNGRMTSSVKYSKLK